MRRKDRALSEQDAYKIIDECVYAVISCACDNGEILSLPLSVVRENSSIFVHGASSGVKSEYFKDERLCKIVAVSHAKVPELSDEFFASIKEDSDKLGNYAFTSEYRSAIATARAHLVTDEKRKIHALRLLSEKYCAKYMSAFKSAIKGDVMKHMNIYEFKITELSAKAKVVEF